MTPRPPAPDNSTPAPAPTSGPRLPVPGSAVPGNHAPKPQPLPVKREARPKAKAAACRAPREELEILIRARYPIVYLVSWEEERAEQYLAEIAERRKKKLFVWTLTQGLVKHGSEPQRSKGGAGSTTDPLAALDAVLDNVEPAIFLFKDFHPFMEENRANLAIVRRLRDVAYRLRDTYKTIVVVAPMLRMAPDLSKDVTVLELGLPTLHDFGRLLDRIIDDVKDKPGVQIQLDGEGRERLLRAAQGLTIKEAENVFAKTLVMDGCLDADDVTVVFSEKQQIIKKSGLLEYCDSQEDISHVAGLESLKQWLTKRGLAFGDKAKEFGLPAPRGVLLLGMQGCGKSLCAKAVSSMWRIPLLRFDVGRMFGSLVGSSEENVRRAIQTAESVAPAILWIDEIDKAFAGALGSAGSDGGTASRVFGTLLTWLSEKKSSVFVIATANDVSALPPELLRKGRLDEIFYIDLPTEPERRDVFRIHLERRGREAKQFDLARLAQVSEGFSGAEIEEAIISALFDVFSSGGQLDTESVAASITSSVPLSKTMSEELTRLRGWAHGRTRPASGPAAAAPEMRRKIELDYPGSSSQEGARA
jgi:AAA+ superfamily predicted ATPase